ncbi:MAG: hypothetical protein ACPF80_02570 [Flavobacteriaceae bacterium]
METKIVIKVFLFFLFGILYCFSQDNNPVFIYADIKETIVLNENYCEKKITEDEVIFSFGLETLGEINHFIYNKKTGVKKINCHRLNDINFSSIHDLNKVLLSTNKIKTPNEVFDSIFIVEKKKGVIKMYKVEWKKIFYPI